MNNNDRERLRELITEIDNSTCHDTSRPFYAVGYDRCRQEVKAKAKALFPEVFGDDRY